MDVLAFSLPVPFSSSPPPRLLLPTVLVAPPPCVLNRALRRGARNPLAVPLRENPLESRVFLPEWSPGWRENAVSSSPRTRFLLDLVSPFSLLFALSVYVYFSSRSHRFSDFSNDRSFGESLSNGCQNRGNGFDLQFPPRRARLRSFRVSHVRRNRSYGFAIK